MTVLDARKRDQILRAKQLLETRGQLLSAERIRVTIGNFRRRFDPERLLALRGTELLETMHQHGNRDSLVYWLEFKADDEFPRAFGSIAGGSALKFGIYRRSETGAWMTGSPSNQREITVDEAIAIAEHHRDELVAGAAAVSKLPNEPTREAYTNLENEMKVAAPELASFGWAHNYFCLAVPEHLDDYLNFLWQRFMLLKMLVEPPEDDRRYEAAYPFVAAARELGMSVFQFTRVLNELHSEPQRWWRIGTSETAPRDQWQPMQSRRVIAIGWPALGDLSSFQRTSEDKERIRALLNEHYPKTPQSNGRLTQQIFNFVATGRPGDLVVAADGQTILGVARITGDYRFDEAETFPHARPVEWLSTEEWKFPEPSEGLQTTFKEIVRAPNLIAIERRIDGAATPVAQPNPVPTAPRLDSIGRRVDDLLERKGQVILYGPPGTGKTYRAEKIAREITAWTNFRHDFEALSGVERDSIVDPVRGYVRLTTFHPSYGYEDFLEGYRPSVSNGALTFSLRTGIFKQLCRDASAQPEKRFFLLIDEINRGDIPRIFGELITVLEFDKRGKQVVLPVSGESFQVPNNVRVIGTMNTADRSIALLDIALRRRFAFVELMPDPEQLVGVNLEVNLPALLRRINDRIQQHVKRDARNLQIGHAYLMHKGRPIAELREVGNVLRNDIIPLLQEYCYEDTTALREILGEGFVDAERGLLLDNAFDGVQALRDALNHLGKGLLADADVILRDETDVGDASADS